MEYAHCASESRRPDLWRGLCGAWVPSAGPSGLLLRDRSGMGRHGTLTAMTANADWVMGDNPLSPGYVLDFDGASDDRVLMGTLPYRPNLWAGGATFSTWIYLRGYGETGNGGIFSKQDADDGSLFYSRNSNSGLAFFIRWGTTNGQWTWALGLNVWAHIVFCYNESSTANKPTLYIDGQLASRTEVTAPAGTATDDSSIQLTLGNRADGLRTFDGYIGDSLFYNRELTATEAQDLYANARDIWTVRRVAYIVPSGQTLTASPVAIPAAIPTHTIAGTGNTNITASPVAAPIVIPTHTISGSGTVTLTASPVATPAAIPTHTIGATGTATLTASPVTAPAAIPTHTIGGTGTTTLTASPVTAPASIPTHTIGGTGNVSLTASPVTAPAAIPTHTISGSGSVSLTASPVSAPLVIPTHDIAASSAGLITATPIVVAAALPAATISGSGSVSIIPSPVVATLAIPGIIIAGVAGILVSITLDGRAAESITLDGRAAESITLDGQATGAVTLDTN